MVSEQRKKRRNAIVKYNLLDLNTKKVLFDGKKFADRNHINTYCKEVGFYKNCIINRIRN